MCGRTEDWFVQEARRADVVQPPAAMLSKIVGVFNFFFKYNIGI